VFSLIHLVPGDPAQAMLGEGASPADVAQLRQRLGLDRPLTAQYAEFMKGLLTGDLGSSMRFDRPVTTVILERMPATAELAAAMLVAIVVASSASWPPSGRLRSTSAR
jgi:peptide/nickel transport system permease protein